MMTLRLTGPFYLTLFPADYEMPRQRYANDGVDEGSVVDQLTRRLNCLGGGGGGGARSRPAYGHGGCG